jgi:anti-anti-sigma factor
MLYGGNWRDQSPTCWLRLRLVPGAVLQTLAACQTDAWSAKELDAMVSTVFSRDMGAPDCDSAPLVTRDGERAVVWLEGEQDIATLFVLADTLANVIAADDADVTVDLSGVTFMSTATVDELIRDRNLLLDQSRNLTLRSPSKCARRLVDFYGMAGFVEPT